MFGGNGNGEVADDRRERIALLLFLTSVVLMLIGIAYRYPGPTWMRMAVVKYFALSLTAKVLAALSESRVRGGHFLSASLVTFTTLCVYGPLVVGRPDIENAAGGIAILIGLAIGAHIALSARSQSARSGVPDKDLHVDCTGPGPPGTPIKTDRE